MGDVTVGSDGRVFVCKTLWAVYYRGGWTVYSMHRGHMAEDLEYADALALMRRELAHELTLVGRG